MVGLAVVAFLNLPVIFPALLIMTTHVESNPASQIQTAQALAQQFAASAVERDEKGGTPKAERDAIRASGLLSLSIPRQYGGTGASWTQTLDVVRTFARVDSSIAHVFGFHHLLLATVRLFGRPDQWEPWFEQTAQKNWFWGNTLNPLDTRTVVQRLDNGYEFSGRKSFCSGALDSDMLVASGLDAVSRKLLIAAIPTSRSGITLNHDWNSFGQRQTDSGSALFENVRVEESELLLEPGPLSTPFACLRPLLAQLIFTQMFLGIGEGVFAEMKHYTRHESRPWFKSPAEQASKDPHTLRRYGEFWVGLESVRLLAGRAVQLFDEAWARGAELDETTRGHVAVAIATAKVAATRVGLDLTSRMFEVAGARATHGALRLDRFWRNLRTQTLHDPVDYKLQELGEWAVNDELPTPSFYS
ncbi:Acyl-CoA dehydrogenase [Burkholderia sp. YR290]|jgi:alkylation response protein AidB-like acyl-CoA dehydrogenase|nr:Acyl-CoA dehydrogenase [Paraburkholderia hospita]SOE83783.1 Acyl-CoA dehydrogenase [Burkholderia sp. YR290]